jgi:hypothetical protein
MFVEYSLQGGNALFEGKVRGNPKPQVVWTRKGLQMKGEDTFKLLLAAAPRHSA